MKSLDLSPAPGSAPLSRQVRSQAAMEARLMMRNGEQVGVALVIPVLALVGGVVAADRIGLSNGHSPIDTVTPGVFALGIMSTAFTALAIATGFERRYGLIKRLGASPLPRHGLMLGKVLALLAIQLLQVIVIGGAALALGWNAPGPGGALAALLVAVLGTAAFSAWALLLAGAVRAEATLALANLVYLLLLAGGAVLVPASSYGRFEHLAVWLPSGALGEGMRTAMLDGSVAPFSIMVLMVWTFVGALLAARTFKWE